MVVVSQSHTTETNGVVCNGGILEEVPLHHCWVANICSHVGCRDVPIVDVFSQGHAQSQRKYTDEAAHAGQASSYFFTTCILC